jgi:hypothetical protein
MIYEKTKFECHGTLTLSNHGGLEIELSDDGESARLRYYNELSRWQEVKHNTKGFYVTYYGCPYYLSEFMRTEIHQTV